METKIKGYVYYITQTLNLWTNVENEFNLKLTGTPTALISKTNFKVVVIITHMSVPDALRQKTC